MQIKNQVITKKHKTNKKQNGKTQCATQKMQSDM